MPSSAEVPPEVLWRSYLQKKGHDVILFHSDKRPELIVGESLVPAIVLMLRELGVEDAVKGHSVYKPGATIWLGMEEEVSFGFSLAKGKIPSYAYNTPRNLFDATLLTQAGNAGVKIVTAVAEIEYRAETDEVYLSKKTLENTGGFLKSQPDFIVDATGRARLLPRILGIPFSEGGRKDIALFAHHENVKLANPGNIHVDRHRRGWGWRIPLPGRVSVGIVVDQKYLLEFGNSKDQWYDGFLRHEPGLLHFTSEAKRITPVAQYTNYQKISTKMVGHNWALVGDSAGFLDPIFSTGLFLSMRSAFELAKAITQGTQQSMRKYEKERIYELGVWQQIIETWYNGRLFTLFRVGQEMKHTFLGRIIDPHMTKHVTRIFTGEAGDGSYSRRLLKFMTTYGLKDKNPDELKIN